MGNLVTTEEEQKEIQVYEDSENNLFVVLDKNKEIVNESDETAMYHQKIKDTDNDVLEFIGDPILINKEEELEEVTEEMDINSASVVAEESSEEVQKQQVEMYEDGENNLFVVLDEDKNIVTESDESATYYQIVEQTNNSDIKFIGEPVLIPVEVEPEPEREMQLESNNVDIEESEEVKTVKDTNEIVLDELQPETAETENIFAEEPTGSDRDITNSKLANLKIELEKLEKGTSAYRDCLVSIQEMFLNLINDKTSELSVVYKSNQLDQESYADDVMFAQNLTLEFKEFVDEFEAEIKATLETSRSAVIGRKVYKPQIKLNPEKVLRDESKYS